MSKLVELIAIGAAPDGIVITMKDGTKYVAENNRFQVAPKHVDECLEAGSLRQPTKDDE